MKRKFIKFTNGVKWILRGNVDDLLPVESNGVTYLEADKESMYVFEWAGSSGTYDVYRVIEVGEDKK